MRITDNQKTLIYSIFTAAVVTGVGLSPVGTRLAQFIIAKLPQPFSSLLNSQLAGRATVLATAGGTGYVAYTLLAPGNKNETDLSLEANETDLSLEAIEKRWPNKWSTEECEKWKSIIREKMSELESSEELGPEDFILLLLGDEEPPLKVPDDLRLGIIEELSDIPTTGEMQATGEMQEVDLTSLQLPKANGRTLYGPLFFLIANALSKGDENQSLVLDLPNDQHQLVDIVRVAGLIEGDDVFKAISEVAEKKLTAWPAGTPLTEDVSVLFSSFGDSSPIFRQMMHIHPYWQGLFAMTSSDALGQHPIMGKEYARFFIEVGFEQFFSFVCRRLSSVYDLKLQLQDKYGSPPQETFLVWNNKRLEDYSTLVFNNDEDDPAQDRIFISPESTIYFFQLTPIHPEPAVEDILRRLFPRKPAPLEVLEKWVGDSNNLKNCLKVIDEHRHRRTYNRINLSLNELLECLEVLSNSFAELDKTYKIIKIMHPLSEESTQKKILQLDLLLQWLAFQIKKSYPLIVDHVLDALERGNHISEIPASSWELIKYFGKLERGRTKAQRVNQKVNCFSPKLDEDRASYCARFAKEIKTHYEAASFLTSDEWKTAVSPIPGPNLGDIAKQELLRQMSEHLIDLYQAGKTILGLKDIPLQPLH